MVSLTRRIRIFRLPIFRPMACESAFHLDRVLVRIKETAGDNQKAEGEVAAVLERGILELPGTFEKSKKFGFVVPDDPRFNSDIFIPADKAKGVPNGYKVVCRITKWAENRRNLEGKIIEVLGSPSDPETDMMAIIRKHGLNETFPKNVMKEAKNIPQMIPEKEIRRRKELAAPKHRYH
jgi:ribonuclease R